MVSRNLVLDEICCQLSGVKFPGIQYEVDQDYDGFFPAVKLEEVLDQGQVGALVKAAADGLVEEAVKPNFTEAAQVPLLQGDEPRQLRDRTHLRRLSKYDLNIATCTSLISNKEAVTVPGSSK